MNFELRIKKRRNNFGNLLMVFLIFSVAAVWLFSLPLKIQETKAGAGDVILLWDTAQGPIPSGWTCLSCAPGSPFYGVFPRASSTYGISTAGSDNHSHTLSYSGAAAGANDDTAKGNSGSAAAINSHSHAWPSPTGGSGDVRPPFKNLNFIKATNPSQLPPNIIAIFDTDSLPSGWTRYALLDDRYLRGYSDNTTGGSATHAHSTGPVTSGASGAALSDTGSGNSAANSHTHSVAASALSNADNAPPFVEVVFAYNSSGLDAAIPTGIIAFFDSAPPAGWSTISNTSPWQGNFLKGASVFGASGGSGADHNHSGSITFNSGVPSSVNNNRGASGSLTAAHNTHTHGVTYNISSAGSLPVYRDVILAKKAAALPPASWQASENAASVIGLNRNIRLRLQAANAGTATTSDLRLEYAQKTGTLCGDDENFIVLPTAPTTEHFTMATSPGVSDNEPTAQQLTSPGYTFVPGEIVAYPSNSSGGFNLDFERYSEFEFVFKAIDGASGRYCFRLSNAGRALDEYSVYPELEVIP